MEIGQLANCKLGVLKIDDLIAFDTDQVMMLLQIAVETGKGGEMIGSPRQAQIGQPFQRAVYGSAGYAGYARLHVVINLVHGRMIMALEQCGEDCPALYCHWNAALPAGRAKSL